MRIKVKGWVPREETEEETLRFLKPVFKEAIANILKNCVGTVQGEDEVQRRIVCEISVEVV